MCTPAFAALLWLGRFPAVEVVLVGLLTTFAGYTAVYALNDVVDYRIDREKAAAGGLAAAGSDIDGVIVRHPMAQGLLSFTEGWVWTLSWSTVALMGAFVLNPVCILIFVGGCVCEAVYCRLWRVSPYRTLQRVEASGPWQPFSPWTQPLHRGSWRCCFLRCSSGKSVGRTSPTT
jgi:4-hydroxybenzoate polyprenyltransferase